MTRGAPIFLFVLLTSIASSALAQPARLEQQTFTSVSVGTRSFYLYLPPGYDSTADRYPLAVLLRGVETEWITPTQDAARQGSIMTVADSLWRSGAMPPVILLMPRISSPPTWADAAYIADELLPWVDARYRTIPTRWHRAVDGFSYGGLGSAMLVTHAPERFISAGGYDGSLFLYEPAWLELWRPERRALYAAMQFLYTTTGPGETGNQSTNRAFVDTLAKYGIVNGYEDIHLAPNAQHNWYFADLHVTRTLPRHMSRMSGAPQRLDVSATLPPPDTTLSGDVALSWSISAPPPSLRVFAQISRDAGRRWSDLGVSRAADSTIVWNTLSVPDGTRYQVRLIATGDTSYRELRTAGTFHVDNPGNGAPEIALVSPLPGKVSGTVTLRWFAEDPERSAVTTSVHVSSDDGTSWTTLASGRAARDSVSWSTTGAANGSRYRLRLTASDGSALGETVSEPFAVLNERQQLPYVIERVSGRGDLEARVFAQYDHPELTASFRIQLHRTLADVRYSIRSIPGDSLLVPPTLIGKPDEEGPVFQGKRLAFTTVDTPEVWSDRTRWIHGSSNVIGTVTLPSLTVDGATLNGIPTPDDHLITVTSDVSDTSMAAFGLPEQPVRFTVRTVGTEAHPWFIFLDPDGSGGLSHGDEIYFVPSGSMPPVQLGWWVVFTSPSQVIPPAPGDVFQVRIRKPPEDGDSYIAFTTYLNVRESTHHPVQMTLDPAYPNPFNASTTIRYRLTDRTYASLIVVDLLGRHVATLADGPHSAGEHTIAWNAGTFASGVYFLRLRAGGSVVARKLLLMK